MKRYSFALAKVLRVRRVEEELAAVALAAARHAEAEAEARLAARRAAYDAMGTGPRIAPVDAFQAQRARAALAAQAVAGAASARAEAGARSDARRRGWAAAATRVSALERLDERRLADHGRALRRAEAAAVDDIVNRAPAGRRGA